MIGPEYIAMPCNVERTELKSEVCAITTFRRSKLSEQHGIGAARAKLALYFIGVELNHKNIGIQFIGKPWSEAKLLQIAYAMEVSWQTVL